MSKLVRHYFFFMPHIPHDGPILVVCTRDMRDTADVITSRLAMFSRLHVGFLRDYEEAEIFSSGKGAKSWNRACSACLDLY